MRVMLDDLIEAMEFQNEEVAYYYDVRNESIIMVYDGLVDDEDDPELLEEIEYGSDNFISVPDRYDINEYHIMENFINEQNNVIVRNELSQAIIGKRAFRRFKDTAIELNVIETWYKYRENALEKIAKKWCSDNNIEYIEGRL